MPVPRPMSERERDHSGHNRYGGDVEMLHLRYFVAVAEELNFTRAAERLHMATSPLSQRIRDLERELGSQLLRRTSRKVELTAAGERLLPAAREVVGQFDALPDLVRTRAPATRRLARVGIAPDVSSELRTRVLGALATAHPELEVRLRPASSEPLLRALRARELDLALIHGPVGGRGLRTTRLDTQPVGAVVGRGAGFDGRDSVHLEELAGLPFASIGYDAAPELCRGIDELLNRFGVRKRLVVEDHNLGGLAHVVTSGQAFTLVGLGGSGMTGKVFAGEPVVLLRVADARLKITTEAVWLADRAVEGSVVAALAGAVTGLADAAPRSTEAAAGSTEAAAGVADPLTASP
ncbi:MAG TPA: LysR family transcriptional regulator [Pseudonocardia sp.]